jgi:hypothetical protein
MMVIGNMVVVVVKMMMMMMTSMSIDQLCCRQCPMNFDAMLASPRVGLDGREATGHGHVDFALHEDERGMNATWILHCLKGDHQCGGLRT